MDDAEIVKKIKKSKKDPKKLAQLHKLAEDHVIRSPQDGLVVNIVKVGQEIVAGETVVAQIVNPKKVYVSAKFSKTEKYAIG